MRVKRTICTVIGTVIPFVALAITFPDVPADHPHATEIGEMQRLGIMKGNDDGTFSPNRELNRAELLTIAYRAAGKEVRAIYYDGSFPDVPKNAWFTDVIYTARHNGDIQGNPDGTAAPARTVNVAEASKIILNALGFEIPPPTQEDRLSVGAFTRASTTAWYVPWVNVGFAHQLYPDELVEENRFDPSAALSRGLAAAFLDRAMKADRIFPERREEQPETREDLPPPPDDDPGTFSSVPDDAEVTELGATRITFPFRLTGQTGRRGAAPFAFTLSERTTLIAKAANSGGKGITLLLYRLEEGGFSTEFYTGYEEESSAVLRATVPEGEYQIEVRTADEGELFTLSGVPSTGDQNDGFIEAKSLIPRVPRAGLLPAYDYEDWFRFTVSEQAKQTLKLITEFNLDCSIYPGSDVDLFGFRGPACNASYTYPPGEYHVSVKRKSDAGRRQSYTIELR